MKKAERRKLERQVNEKMIREDWWKEFLSSKGITGDDYDRLPVKAQEQYARESETRESEA